MHRRIVWLPLLLLALLAGLAAPQAARAAPAPGTYRNPLDLQLPDGSQATSCADPTAIYGQEGEARWYLYCTTDPLNSQDKTGDSFNFNLIPQFSSADLVHWVYEGAAFSERPAYATANAGLWAPEIAYYPASGEYHLYYTVTDTTLPGGGSAIGVATSPSPTGPWTHAATPVVEPHGADCCGPDSRRWVFDPDVLRTDGPDYIYYGSYFGGISVRRLSEDGLRSDPASQQNMAVANKYEGAEVVQRGGFFYLFASATDCCRGPLTGYSVFVGRASSPTGPFLDRDGVDMNDNEPLDDPTDGRVGGTPVITMNGNRWVGPGHNTVFQDFDGQWWTIYHAIDAGDPYFAGAVGFTRRPALLDPIDWIDGWPTLNGGAGPSDRPQAAPAAQPGQQTQHHARPALSDEPSTPIDALSDSFSGDQLRDGWEWVRGERASYRLAGGVLSFDTQAADLFEDSDNASVLTEPAPSGNYMAETRVRVSVPAEGCCFNYVQAGLVIYADDDNYVKLSSVSIWNTRQTEFAKEQAQASMPAGYPRYGNTVVGPPGEWTWLRIVRREQAGDVRYTAYTSRDGTSWVRGGTWAHDLGASPRIGLVAMGGAGFTAEFDYVRVSRLRR